MAAYLSRFHKLPTSRLAVAGLNPHTGEAGAFGDEEQRVIQTAAERGRTQGLRPIVRTSPDHGTAFDIAGLGKASPCSMQAAITLAAERAKVEAP